MTAKKASIDVPEDLDALSPSSDTITLESGFEVKIERLRTRGMFKLLKIVTRGAGPILMQMKLNFEDSEAFVGQLLAVVMMAIPEAEDEALEFIQFMTVPSEYNPDSKAKGAAEKNKELFERLALELDDPNPLDTMNIIARIIENESHDIQALGKQLAALLKTQMGFLAVKN